MNKLIPFLTLIFLFQMNSNLKAQVDDPYIWMEEVESKKSMDWVLRLTVQQEPKLKLN